MKKRRKISYNFLYFLKLINIFSNLNVFIFTFQLQKKKEKEIF